MGLSLAKLYIKNETTSKDFLVHYNGISWTLKPGQRYFFPDDDFLEIIYTIDEVNFTYSSGEDILTKYTNGELHFTLIENVIDNLERKSVVYPLQKNCKSVHVNRVSEKEYKKSKNTILSRYMEYRD